MKKTLLVQYIKLSYVQHGGVCFKDYAWYVII